MNQTVKLAGARLRRFSAHRCYTITLDMRPIEGRRIWPVRRAGAVKL